MSLFSTQRISLSEHWKLKQRDGSRELLTDFAASDGWIPATVPGTVHQDLLNAGKIPDPFFGLNENLVQWIGETDWLYRCTFDVSESLLNSPQVDLCFDGLDTFAAVYLNDRPILNTENMFVPARVSVKSLLQAGNNSLAILFKSAFNQGKELEAQYGKRAAWNGDTSRVYIRKAQYHYGWDWGPVLITAGVWRPVYLEAYATRITDVHIPVEVSADLREAVLPIKLTLNHSTSDSVQVRLNLYDPAGELAQTVTVPANSGNVHTFNVTNPALWYPNGHGDQPRYRITAELIDGSQVLDSREVKLGLRRLRLVQEPVEGESGTSFYFEINNIPVFCGGVNWIPADSFSPRVTPEKYRAWLKLAADGNMNMLRVWGGGIYEEDVFYDLCDEMGLLVWQDFMFACGMYPAHPEFLAKVRAEAEANVLRLRNHASIVLWCGNNEDYQIAASVNAYDPTITENFAESAFPAREIYERLLPQICAAVDPTRPYWPGSPYGGPNGSDPTYGDRHVWEVWHGNMDDYQNYPNYYSRFISEFGMQSVPEMVTIETFVPTEAQSPHSEIMVFHNKASDGPKRLDHYINRNTGMSDDLAEYIYLSQFVQSEALSAAVSGWWRRWGKPGQRATAGALIWQLNDCYPVTSWAIVDCYLKPKAAYYRLKRSFAPVSVGVAVQNDQEAAYWAVNNSTQPLNSEIVVQTWSLDGQCIRESRQTVQIGPNQTAELGTIPLSAAERESCAVSVRLLNGENVLARVALFPEPPQTTVYGNPDINITTSAENTIRLEVSRPVRGLYLSADRPVQWGDNMLDLVPGDPVEISAAGLSGARITARWFGGSSRVATAEIEVK